MGESAVSVVFGMEPDTNIGGPQSRFPETRRTAVADLRSPDANLRERAWEAVIAAYWKPVYKYVRVRWSESNENAKDLTQAFFTRGLEKDFFGGYDPAKARFRTYLRTCLDAFLANENKAAGRLKRGGDAVSLAFETPDGKPREIASNELSPEEYFRREWVRNLFSLAAEDLKRECAESGKRIHYEIFERYDLNDGGERPTYDGMAVALGLTPATVTNHLAGMRRRFRHLLLERIRETTVTEQEFREEARAVLGIEA